jgi:orotate phosphoribosyltransferase-like protein
MTSTVAERPAEKRPKEAATLARELRCLELRIQGYSYERIAKELHISISTAFERTKVATERLHEQVIATADKLRSLQLVRYEHMVNALWHQATTPGTRGQLHAMEMLVRVMERIDRVGGTEAPMRKIVWVVDETTLYEATKKIEDETADMEQTIARREALRAGAISVEVVEDNQGDGSLDHALDQDDDDAD